MNRFELVSTKGHKMSLGVGQGIGLGRQGKGVPVCHVWMVVGAAIKGGPLVEIMILRQTHMKTLPSHNSVGGQ